MSLRLKLLLLGLLTLVLPWGGCQYAREMESALREAEKQSLLAMAETLAASLQGRTDLLYRADVNGPDPPGPFDLQPVLLSSAPFLDGYGYEWPKAPAAWRTAQIRIHSSMSATDSMLSVKRVASGLLAASTMASTLV